MKKEIHKAVSFVEMLEEDLKSFLLSRYEYLKEIDEKQKSDEHLQKLKDAFDDYKDERYTDVRKSTKAEIKAARSVAKARGIKFELPKDVK